MFKNINTKIWKGLIFINFSVKPKSFGATFNDVEKILTPFKLENFYLIEEFPTELKAIGKYI